MAEEKRKFMDLSEFLGERPEPPPPAPKPKPPVEEVPKPEPEPEPETESKAARQPVLYELLLRRALTMLQRCQFGANQKCPVCYLQGRHTPDCPIPPLLDDLSDYLSVRF